MGRRFVGRRLVPSHVIQQRLDAQDARREQELRDRIAAFRRRTSGPYPWSPDLVVTVVPGLDPIIVDISRLPKSGGDQ